MNWVSWILRWLHLVAAITAVGGTIFMRFALVPSVVVLSDEQRKMLHEQVRSRWAKLVMASIGFLLLSGLINYLTFYFDSKKPAWDAWRESYKGLYQAVFGVKFLLAMAIFFIASALAGRSEATKTFRQNAKWWMTLNVVFALAVVALSGILRSTHTGPTFKPETSQPSAASMENSRPGSELPTISTVARTDNTHG
ncbi:MAG TPA: hypothetical protein VGJ15_01385 [Pirellulales bacterium]|jgi:uncharacterized membrane protein